MNDISDIVDRHFYISGKGRIYADIINSIEKTVILKALEKSNGNQLVAASLLGMNRNTLHKKIVQFGIDVWRFKS
jgi:two-component system, NtrC family, nitrogen regulation response regulator GlnG